MPFIDKNFQQQTCFSVEHLPPMNIVLPPGEHQYQCPSCGKLTVINVPNITNRPDYAYDEITDSYKYNHKQKHCIDEFNMIGTEGKLE